MGKYIHHRLVARPELDDTFWTDSTNLTLGYVNISDPKTDDNIAFRIFFKSPFISSPVLSAINAKL